MGPLFQILLLAANGLWGFTLQNSIYHLTPISGSIEVVCSSRSRSDFDKIFSPTHTCRRNYLDPIESEKWIGPIHPLAFYIEFLSLHPDGSNYFLRTNYDGQIGKTKEPVLLWNDNLFQDSFLNRGNNKIHYELKSMYDQTLMLGDFEINVEESEPRKCQSLIIDLSQGVNCPEAPVLCESYFAKKNYCK